MTTGCGETSLASTKPSHICTHRFELLLEDVEALRGELGVEHRVLGLGLQPAFNDLDFTHDEILLLSEFGRELG